MDDDWYFPDQADDGHCYHHDRELGLWYCCECPCVQGSETAA